jgi:hypothetical protein
MRAMTVVIVINAVLKNGLSPCSTSLKLGVLDVDTSVKNIDINASTSDNIVGVLVEGGEAEPIPVADACKALIAGN